jgi:protein-disulfide isomerase
LVAFFLFFMPIDPTSSSVRTSNPWLGISVGLLGVIIGYALGAGMQPVGATIPNPSLGNQQAQIPEPKQPTGTPPKTGVGPTIGSDRATITLVEFTDFQCPFCSRHYQQTFGLIKKDYVDTGKVKYEMRHYPLSFHPNAEISSEAAMCAHAQDKFWEMHSKLFAGQGEWSNLDNAGAIGVFKRYAADIGLNAGSFASCLDNHETQETVRADFAAGGIAGIDGTPGFWIIGRDGKTKQISGAYPYDTFKAAFDEML